MKTIQAYKKIEGENIPILDCKIDGVKGVIIKAGDKYGIFINHREIENSDEEFMILAHEWGHYTSGMLYCLGSDKTHISQCEYKADRKAIIEFLPFERIKDAIKNGCQTAYEFSEFLDLPEQFIVKAFKHYKNMGLI